MLGTMQVMPTEHKKAEPEPSKGKRLRLIVDIDDDKLSAAVQLRASKLSVVYKRRVSKSEVVSIILKESLGEELGEIDRAIGESTAKKRKP